jgi:hypothetical protein
LTKEGALADNDYPKPQVVLPDDGGWISGPSISFDDVFAAEITVGNKLLLDDGIVADVTRVKHGLFWLPDEGGQGAALGQGVSITWTQSDGNAEGILVRPPGCILRRVTGDAR